MNVLFLQTLYTVCKHALEAFVVFHRGLHRGELVKVGFVVVAAKPGEQVLRTDVGFLVQDVENLEQQVDSRDATVGEFVVGAGGRSQRGFFSATG